ncbi:hypothetical protein XBKQ1_2670004 [Xenorhabdus bovienii str. kraussei Quebec]|uniref:Uncharacterized protein n=1 Tax=Xenorhabdus bovienii str. kraussei Quebec TaxID=1398203 RepID=A0A077PIT3_XENBV|nr:hypothetical protein XBKQ1_2670004 [Xenorhabdus bovienii str. kraussei Quebec]
MSVISILTFLLKICFATGATRFNLAFRLQGFAHSVIMQSPIKNEKIILPIILGVRRPMERKTTLRK